MTSTPISTTVAPSVAAQHLWSDPQARTARAEEKRRKILRLLRLEGWTTTEVVTAMLGIGYSAAYQALKTMERDGLTTALALFVPGKAGATKMVLHGITSQGLAYAYDLDEAQDSRSPWEPSKTNPLFVPHQVMTQLARVRAEQEGWKDWRPARALMGLGLPKLPDGEGMSPEGVRVAVEVEREIKTDRRYEAVIGAYIAQMKADGRWQRVDYLCPDADFAARLARIFGQLSQLRLEQPGKPSKSGRLEQAHLDRFRFYAHDHWPAGDYIVAARQDG